MKSIIMSGNHPTLILSGKKTQTRRVMEPQPHEFIWMFRQKTNGCFQGIERDSDRNCDRGPEIKPRLQVGGLAYIKEAYFHRVDEITGKLVENSKGEYDQSCIVYRDGFGDQECHLVDGDGFAIINRDGSFASPWKSPLHMPQWASRITVRITRVWAERVQEISSSDAIAEGVCHSEFWKPSDVEGKPFEDQWHDDHQFWSRYPQLAYAKLWDSINGKTHPWESNCWVWAYEFEVMPNAN